MITLLDNIGSAIWRASWQAALLALVVAMILWGLGARLSPRWRFLLWGVVLTRFLCVATPGAPWSAFNLIRWTDERTPILAGAEIGTTSEHEPPIQTDNVRKPEPA